MPSTITKQNALSHAMSSIYCNCRHSVLSSQGDLVVCFAQDDLFGVKVAAKSAIQNMFVPIPYI